MLHRCFCNTVISGVPERKRVSLAAVVLSIPILLSHGLSDTLICEKERQSGRKRQFILWPVMNKKYLVNCKVQCTYAGVSLGGGERYLGETLWR